MKVDITTEFFVRVIATKDGVSTRRPHPRRPHAGPDGAEEYPGRLVDDDAVAATMTMDDIHENRAGYIWEVSGRRRRARGERPRTGNGGADLFDEADISVFDPSSHFDAEGLTLIVRETEERRKLRNQIENDARSRSSCAVQAEQRVIEIDRDLEGCRRPGARDIEEGAAIGAIEAGTVGITQIAINQSRTKAEEEAERVLIAKGRVIDEGASAPKTRSGRLRSKRQRDLELTEITSRTRVSFGILARRQIEAERIQREHEIREAQINSPPDCAAGDQGRRRRRARGCRPGRGVETRADQGEQAGRADER